MEYAWILSNIVKLINYKMHSWVKKLLSRCAVMPSYQTLVLADSRFCCTSVPSIMGKANSLCYPCTLSITLEMLSFHGELLHSWFFVAFISPEVCQRASWDIWVSCFDQCWRAGQLIWHQLWKGNKWLLEHWIELRDERAGLVLWVIPPMP